MQPLREVNVQKCLDVLSDFQASVPDKDVEKILHLKEKKEQARLAIEQLKRLLKADFADAHLSPEPCTCPPGQKSQSYLPPGH